MEGWMWHYGGARSRVFTCQLQLYRASFQQHERQGRTSEGSSTKSPTPNTTYKHIIRTTTPEEKENETRTSRKELTEQCVNNY